MENEIKNRGVKIVVTDASWKVGSTSKISYESLCKDWTPFMPDFDNQFGTVDFQRCVSESYVHSVVTRLNFLLANGYFSQRQIDALTSLGYIKNGKFDISIRALAKMSGTDETGNSQEAVAECGRTQGLIPNSDWSTTSTMGWAEHYAEIPQNLLNKAKQFLQFVSLPYEWVVSDNTPVADYQQINQTILKYIEQSPLQFTCPLCPSYSSRPPVIQSCGSMNVIHAMMIYSMKLVNGALNRLVRDSYPPYNLEFANNYPMPFVMNIVASVIKDTVTPTTPQPAQNPIVIPEATQDQVDEIKISWAQTVIGFLKWIFGNNS